MRISVTIPTFNRAHWIGYAIESVLAQTYDNYEIIVIDDGSTDGTAHFVTRYGDRVKYFWQENGGLGAARNAGLAQATGDAVAFLDSDDYWRPFKLELQVALLSALPNAGFIFSEFDILKEDGTLIPQGSRTWLAENLSWHSLYARATEGRRLGVAVEGVPHDFIVYGGHIYKRLLDEALVLPTTAIVRRGTVGDLRFPEGMTIFDDWEFFARMARENEGAFVDVSTAVNRGHDEPGRLTRCSSLSKAKCYLEMLERVWLADARFCLDHPDVVRRAESAAALAVAESALLAGQRTEVQNALARWRRVDGHQAAARAAALALSASLPGGRGLFRAARLGQKLFKRAWSGSKHRRSLVNPTA